MINKQLQTIPLNLDLEVLLEESFCGYLFMDPDGLILKANRTFLDWVGLQAIEVENIKYLRDFLEVGSKIYHETHYAPLLKMQNIVKEISLNLTNKEGKITSVLLSSKVMKDQSKGTFIGSTLFNISDRKHYEKELLEARNLSNQNSIRFELLARVNQHLGSSLDSMNNVEVVCELATHKFSEACVLDLYTNDEKKRIADSCQFTDKKIPTIPFLQKSLLLQKAEEYKGPDEAIVKIISELDVQSLIVVPLLSEDKVIGNLSFLTFNLGKRFNDQDLELAIQISQSMSLAMERAKLYLLSKEQRMQLVASAKMSSLGEMASGLAHEINNPLTIIILNSRIMQQILSTDNFDREFTQSMITSNLNTANRIAAITHGLLKFSHNSELDPMESVPVKKVIEDTLCFCAERFKKQNIDLRIDLNSNEALEVIGKPSQLSQAMLNLLTNSYEAIQSLSEKWILIKVIKEKDKVFIHITDSGKGIPDKIAEKLMEPFFTTKTVGNGPGLGLSISKGLIEQQQGRLVYDRKSANTNFIIELSISNKCLKNALQV